METWSSVFCSFPLTAASTPLTDKLATVTTEAFSVPKKAPFWEIKTGRICSWPGLPCPLLGHRAWGQAYSTLWTLLPRAEEKEAVVPANSSPLRMNFKQTRQHWEEAALQGTTRTGKHGPQWPAPSLGWLWMQWHRQDRNSMDGSHVPMWALNQPPSCSTGGSERLKSQVNMITS